MSDCDDESNDDTDRRSFLERFRDCIGGDRSGVDEMDDDDTETDE